MAKKKLTTATSKKTAKKNVVNLDKLAKDSETTAKATNYQLYLRDRMKHVKMV